MKCQAVIGCGFGDEGKGKVVSWLCSLSSNPLVVRFSGGHQAGHHVMLENGLDHVFSNFGSGTLQGFNTYWSSYCTVDPVGILNELSVLNSKGISPTLYIDLRCPITTPYEKMRNKILNHDTQHGSCGVGVGQTFQREEDHFSLLFEDLYYPSVLKIKLEMLKQYYKYTNDDAEEFLSTCKELVDTAAIRPTSGFPHVSYYDNIIFEGSQGLLLDQSIGFFPHVTRANTGLKNIVEMGFNPEVFLVTRAYQTRHGNGPMTNEEIKHEIKRNTYEQNFDNTYQGKFRSALLDLDVLRYAINKDVNLTFSSRRLVVTCLDLMSTYSYTEKGKVKIDTDIIQFVKTIKYAVLANKVYASTEPLERAYVI